MDNGKLQTIKDAIGELETLQMGARIALRELDPARPWPLGDAIQAAVSAARELLAEVKRASRDPLRVALVDALRSEGYVIAEPAWGQETSDTIPPSSGATRTDTPLARVRITAGAHAGDYATVLSARRGKKLGVVPDKTGREDDVYASDVELLEGSVPLPIYQSGAKT